MNGKSLWKSGNKPATPYCRTRSAGQEGGSRFCDASLRAFSYSACTTSSFAQNSSGRLFRRRAPFFFHRTHDRSPMNFDTVTLLDQSGQLCRIQVGILLLLFESKLKQLALEFDWTLAAALSRKEGSKSQLGEGLLNLIKAF